VATVNVGNYGLCYVNEDTRWFSFGEPVLLTRKPFVTDQSGLWLHRFLVMNQSGCRAPNGMVLSEDLSHNHGTAAVWRDLGR
jgi:hypothetical protein